MKRFYSLFFLAVCCLAVSCEKVDPENEKLADITIKMNDVVLKRICIENFDYNKDGKVSSEEAEMITTLKVNGEGITSMQGIEYMPNLRELNCNYNKIGSLNVSKNSQLTALYCNGCQLTSLDLSNNTALTKLECYSNNITNLDLSKNKNLTDLSCHGNDLTSLDLSKTTNLVHVLCNGNQLSSVKVAGLSKLESLSCYESKLNELDLTGCTSLKSLMVYNNNLTKLDVSSCTKLYRVCCQKNKIETLDLSMCDLMNCPTGFLPIKANDMSTLKTLYLKSGWSIKYITYNRSSDYIPATTEIIFK